MKRFLPRFPWLSHVPAMVKELLTALISSAVIFAIAGTILEIIRCLIHR